VHILESKKAHFKPEQFEDRYETALTDLIRAKQAGKPAPKLSAPPPSNVVNLMDALRRSVKAETGKGQKETGSRRAPARATRNGNGRKRAAQQRTRMKRAS
jgi:DNA end-binding protein Ku